jgi:hypothetical protein
MTELSPGEAAISYETSKHVYYATRCNDHLNKQHLNDLKNCNFQMPLFTVKNGRICDFNSHRCDITHTEDAQLKTTLLNHNLHIKQPRSTEGIDEWRADTHTLGCVVSASGLSAKTRNQVQHVICLRCILALVLQSRTIGVSFELIS